MSQSLPAGSPTPQSPPTVVVQAPRRRGSRIVLILLIASLMANLVMYSSYQEYFTLGDEPQEKFLKGDADATEKIAVLRVHGTIMPPFTERVLRALEKAGEDEKVKGVVLSIDSPGGLVADSHRIYHELVELRTKKPVVVSMGRMAASGGLYIAMGAGAEATIFAEPTTWTGSIGVIIPFYDLRGLAEKVGVDVQPLKTGPFKDSLSPFRELTDEERAYWNGLMNDAFDRFKSIIAENRSDLDADDVDRLADGRIFTAEEAVANGLVDKIGYEDDAIEHLKGQLGLDRVRVVVYKFQPALLELLTSAGVERQSAVDWEAVFRALTPQPMYLFSRGIGAAVP